MRYNFLRFPGGKFKAVTLSYDDGIKDDIRMLEILNKYGIKSTFNLNSDWMNWNDRIPIETIRSELLSKGHEIAVHGAEHIAPGVARPEIVIADILRCREGLEKKFGLIIRGMAYPDSGITRMHGENTYENIRSYIASLGIVYARTLGGDNKSFMLPVDFLKWMPSCHHSNPELAQYVDAFLSIKENELRSANRYPRLFYLWGHSFEFERENNWEILENFCERMSGKDDTWYATNIEIYEYVEAFNRLVTSVDGKKIYNPTLKTIWMDIDGVQYKVESGETIQVK